MQSGFADVDPVVRRWAASKSLPLATHYKDDEVRSFRIVGTSGAECQIWLEAEDAGWTVSVWDLRKRRRDLREGDLWERLDAALELAKAWNSAAAEDELE